MKTAFLTILIFNLPGVLFAAHSTNPNNKLNILIFIQLIGGLSLFLYGMKTCSAGLKAGSGKWLKKIINAMTANPVSGIFSGVLVTFFTQSSSATSVILVSLVNTTLIRLKQVLPVLLGAGIGTTLTVQLIAFKVFDYALILVAIGVLLSFTSGKRQSLKAGGKIILGFGLIFYGMQIMSHALYPIRNNTELISILLYLKNYPLIALFAATLFTSIVQASGATLALLISFALQGSFGVTGVDFIEISLPMIFGANLGTCITAFIGSIGTSREAKRVAIAQLFQKSIGVALFFPLIPVMALLITSITGANQARQIANAHTLFNIALTLLILPLNRFVLFTVNKILPVKDKEKPFAPIYLDKSLLGTPDLAIDHAKMEILRQGKIVEKQIERISALFYKNDYKIIHLVSEEDEKADILQKAAAHYLNKITARDIGEKKSLITEKLFFINSDIESIGDIVVKNIVPLAKKLQRKPTTFSEQGWNEISSLHKAILKQMSTFLDAFAHDNLIQMRNIITAKRRINKKIEALKRSHLSRLQEGYKESIITSSIHLDLLDHFRKLNSSISGMCRYFID